MLYCIRLTEYVFIPCSQSLYNMCFNLRQRIRGEKKIKHMLLIYVYVGCFSCLYTRIHRYALYMSDLKIVYHGHGVWGHSLVGCVIGQLMARENYVTNATGRTIVVLLDRNTRMREIRI